MMKYTGKIVLSERTSKSTLSSLSDVYPGVCNIYNDHYFVQHHVTALRLSTHSLLQVHQQQQTSKSLKSFGSKQNIYFSIQVFFTQVSHNVLLISTQVSGTCCYSLTFDHTIQEKCSVYVRSK